MSRHCLHCIIPPHLLRKLLESKDKEVRDAALNSMLTTSQLRGTREATAGAALSASPGDGRRTIFDCRHSEDTADGVAARGEDGEPSDDAAVNRAFVGLGTTRDFYKEVLGRNSIDGRGMRLDGFVHYGSQFQNAYWFRGEMVFGDGDGVLFSDFTLSLDVIAHELTHGVTEFTAKLEYHVQPGALNESISDVFGSLIKQWANDETAETADWIIGAEVFTPAIGGDALRSLKAPGTAYDNEMLGKDPQPDHWSKFVVLPDTRRGDWGGVHINSGIPNRAFYLTATGIGGKAWGAAGHVWYESLLASSALTDFQKFADTTYLKAGELYGSGSNEQLVILDAWREVGIRVSGVAAAAPRRGTNPPAARAEDNLAKLVKTVETLSGQVKTLAKEVAALKAKK